MLLIGVLLGNGTDDYPDGDDVAVATIWQTRPMFEGMDADALTAVFARLREAVHSPNKQSRNTPWAGKPLMEIGGRSSIEASKIIAAWIENGVLGKGEHSDPKNRNTVEKVTVNVTKAAEILAEIRITNTPAE